MAPSAATAPLRIGAIGLGRAFSLMSPTFVKHPACRLVGGVDPRAEARRQFERDFAAPAFGAIEDLCAHVEADVLYIATPHQFHAEQACLAARLGKHVFVEKPMAIALDECRAMIDAAERAGVRLLVGHTHSFDAPVARARALIASGRFGRLTMALSFNYTDFLYRPRRPEELDTKRGGGVIFNQAPHQVDVLRTLGGGRLASVSAGLGDWDAQRPTEGAYTALFKFENGVAASLTYSGYAHFDSDELSDWIAESGLPKDPTRYGVARQTLESARSAGGEAALKAAGAYGTAALASPPLSPRLHQHFGFVIASCERADLKVTPAGVMIYGDREKNFDPCPTSEIPRRETIDELFGAVVEGRPPAHDGRWGMATIEACLGILSAGRDGREARLFHQCAYRDPI